MDELFDEKMKVVLNLIRTNNTADDALKITQAAYNLAQARNSYLLTPVPVKPDLEKPKKTGTST